MQKKKKKKKSLFELPQLQSLNLMPNTAAIQLHTHTFFSLLISVYVKSFLQIYSQMYSTSLLFFASDELLFDNLFKFLQ